MPIEALDEKIREAVKSESPALIWENIHGVQSPCAQINLEKFDVGFDSLLLAPVESSQAENSAKPLTATWASEFDPANEDKWLG